MKLDPIQRRELLNNMIVTYNTTPWTKDGHDDGLDAIYRGNPEYTSDSILEALSFIDERDLTDYIVILATNKLVKA